MYGSIFYFVKKGSWDVKGTFLLTGHFSSQWPPAISSAGHVRMPTSIRGTEPADEAEGVADPKNEGGAAPWNSAGELLLPGRDGLKNAFEETSIFLIAMLMYKQYNISFIEDGGL